MRFEPIPRTQVFTMNTAHYIAVGALVLSLFGCSEDATSPNRIDEPSIPQMNVSAAATLTFREVSAGHFHSCGVTSDNRAYCWGYNESGQLGTGSTDGPEECEGAGGPFSCSTHPALVAGGHHFIQVSVAETHSCGITTDNQAYCWGSDADGKLGNGAAGNSLVPVPVAGGRQFRQVEAGFGHTCGVTSGNRAFCWGGNSSGELGDGTTTSRQVPVAVAGGLSFQRVSTSTGGHGFTCGVTTDNRAFCWGDNRSGQVGDSTQAHRRVRPVPVSGNRQFRQVDAGDAHACGATLDTKAFCWGDGRGGELGNGKTYVSFWPRRVAGRIPFERVTAGTTQSCAIGSSDGRAYCWGSNNSGQLGDGSVDTIRLTPVAVNGGISFAQLSAGFIHTCGTSTDGRAFCWGDGFFGQLGNGSQEDAHSPTPVAAPS